MICLSEVTILLFCSYDQLTLRAYVNVLNQKRLCLMSWKYLLTFCPSIRMKFKSALEGVRRLEISTSLTHVKLQALGWEFQSRVCVPDLMAMGGLGLCPKSVTEWTSWIISRKINNLPCHRLLTTILPFLP